MSAWGTFQHIGCLSSAIWAFSATPLVHALINVVVGCTSHILHFDVVSGPVSDNAHGNLDTSFMTLPPINHDHQGGALNFVQSSTRDTQSMKN